MRYKQDGPEFENQWGRDFLYPSTPAPRPTQPPTQWLPGLFPEGKSGRTVVLATHPPLSSAEVKGSIEPYLYSSSEFHGRLQGELCLY
jgi:hypothetical protein